VYQIKARQRLLVVLPGRNKLWNIRSEEVRLGKDWRESLTQIFYDGKPHSSLLYLSNWGCSISICSGRKW